MPVRKFLKCFPSSQRTREKYILSLYLRLPGQGRIKGGGAPTLGSGILPWTRPHKKDNFAFHEH